ncbi:dihydropteroate synthase [Saccharophagus sp. K07]|jgi:dihydropteroate synthase|uniref:dihydropteroate synthase n=1 Tax=Saccharophagus sp. K07 TaxID=2283636 RepID=UPI0016524D00|nr:dihydropteroate synthase [Saccharophagus sp. K07]MBC6906568.1 dihydropteroate synthase [Saccharophagus sp. K07]
MQIEFGSRVLDFVHPRIMGVLNVTPDSFYDGGACYENGVLNLDLALRHAERLVAEGADFLDIGGESTRPGAAPVSPEEECDRVLPVVRAVAERLDVVISVDTSNPLLMREAAIAGAGLINDVRSLQVPGALAAAVASGLPVCVMHMIGTPANMQQEPKYDDVVREVKDFLAERKQECIRAGISAEKIFVDPGIGFGKTDAHNLELLKNLNQFCSLGPVLLGVSRKSMFGRLLGRAPSERLPASLAAGLIGCQKGASILRVHDVAATRDALEIWRLIG